MCHEHSCFTFIFEHEWHIAFKSRCNHHNQFGKHNTRIPWGLNETRSDPGIVKYFFESLFHKASFFFSASIAQKLFLFCGESK